MKPDSPYTEKANSQVDYVPRYEKKKKHGRTSWVGMERFLKRKENALYIMHNYLAVQEINIKLGFSNINNLCFSTTPLKEYPIEKWAIDLDIHAQNKISKMRNKSEREKVFNLIINQRNTNEKK